MPWIIVSLLLFGALASGLAARAEEARVVALGLIVRAEEGACGKDIVASRAVLVTHCGPKQVRAIERKICARGRH